MERSLELYRDGCLYEIYSGQAIKVTETHGQVHELINALRFSTAKTFTIVPPDQQPPDVPVRRGGQQLNQTGLKLLTTFEGCKLKAYDDGVGVWTIGYGHTADVVPGMTITQSEAEELLHQDLAIFESYVTDAIEVGVNSDQFSALVCFCYNTGPGADGFGGSTLLKLLNSGDFEGAVQQFLRWNKGGGNPMLGLTRRRLAEQALFRSQPWESACAYEGPLDLFDRDASSAKLGMRSLKLTNPPMQGEDVKQLQTALVKLGFVITLDGVFGAGTAAAIKQFQQQQGLTADGIAGNQTQQKVGIA